MNSMTVTSQTPKDGRPSRSAPRAAHRRRQQGFTLIEMLAVLALSAVAMGYLAGIARDFVDIRRADIVKVQLEQVNRAAAAHVRANFQNFLDATAGGPVTVMIDDLKAAKRLSASFPTLNPYRQELAVLVRQDGPSSVRGLTVGIGGQDLPSRQLGRIAQAIGMDGGVILRDAPGTVVGSMGSYSLQLGSFGLPDMPGNVAASFFLDRSTILEDYVYRNAVPGSPEANTMSVNLDMAGNNIEDVGELSVDRLDVSQDMAVAGSITGGGNLSVAGAATAGGAVTAGTDMTVNGSLAVAGTATANGQIVSRTGISAQNAAVTGSINARDVNASGAVSAPTLYAATGTIETLSASTATVHVQMNTAGISANSLSAQSLTTPSMNVTGGMTVQGGTSVGGGVVVGGSVETQNLNSTSAAFWNLYVGTYHGP